MFSAVLHQPASRPLSHARTAATAAAAAFSINRAKGQSIYSFFGLVQLEQPSGLLLRAMQSIFLRLFSLSWSLSKSGNKRILGVVVLIS